MIRPEERKGLRWRPQPIKANPSPTEQSRKLQEEEVSVAVLLSLLTSHSDHNMATQTWVVMSTELQGGDWKQEAFKKNEKLQRRSCQAACIDWLKGKTTRHGLMGHQRRRKLFGIHPSTQLEDNKMIWVCGKLHSVLLKSTVCRYVGGTGTLCLGSSPLCSNSDYTGKCCLVILKYLDDWPIDWLG